MPAQLAPIPQLCNRNYSCLTGRYNWRTRLKKSVFFNPHDKPLIEKDEPTIATMLKENGYHTACIGKWHLGIGWQFIKDFKKDPNDKTKQGQGWDIDYSKPAVTPTSNGFDYFYGIQASLDMAPYVYIENKLATKPATVTKAFFRKGASQDDFEANQCLTQWADKSVEYINQRAKEKVPFFLYLPLTSPHTPIVPSKTWKGKSDIGKYGDFLMETDWVIGQVLGALDRNKLSDNTLVIFTTDNGCSPAAGIPKLQKQGHFPNGKLRGHKADIYEGGHRIPFIVRWPGKIKPSTETSRLTCQTDITATIAEVLDHKLADNAGVDSVSFLATLSDTSATERTAIISHSINGSFAIREGKWKLILCKGSGGWSTPKPGKAKKGVPATQLYNLENDLKEANNLIEKHPEIAKRLEALLKTYVDNGRSSTGVPQKNDGAVDISPKQ